jgi:hypothetical protein
VLPSQDPVEGVVVHTQVWVRAGRIRKPVDVRDAITTVSVVMASRFSTRGG